MSRTCTSIRTLHLAALAGVCLVGTTALAQSKATSGVASKLRPVAKQAYRLDGLKHMALFNPGATVVDRDPSSSGGPAPRGAGGACLLPGGQGCIAVMNEQECLDQFGAYMGDGSACPVELCSISEANCHNFEYPRVGGTSQASMGPPNDQLQMIADDFLTTSGGAVTQLCWWGAYTNDANTIDCNNLAPDVDHFVVTIMRLNNGVPDITNVVGSAEQGVNMTVSRRGFCDTGGDGVRRLTYEYTATLSSAINLDANSCYAIEIRNATEDLTLNWFWSRSRDTANNQCWIRTDSNPYSGVATVAGDRAFCIGTDLNIFQSSCAMPPPPICENPDINGQPFAGVNFGGFSASPSPNAVGLQLAERVQFESSGEITNVCFRGFWVAEGGTQPTGPEAPDFDITYWANDNGLPGEQIAAFRVGEPGVNVFRQGFQYRIEHPALPVTAGTCMFFSISRLTEFADPDHNLRFAWWLTAPGTVGDDLAHSRTAAGAEPGPWGNIAFGAGMGDIHFLFDAGPVEMPNCPATMGACCVGTNCSLMTEEGCLAAGGSFQGVGVICNPASCLNPPPNDDCANAQVITGEGSFTYDNRAATCEPNERTTSCTTTTASVWYSWTAPCDGTFTVSMCDQGNTDDNVLSAYEGDCNGPEVTCGDDTCGIGGGPSSITFPATAGTRYLLRFATWNGTECGSSPGDTGSFTISRDDGSCGGDCPCNFNGDQNLNSQDFFDFLACFFTAGCAEADYNGSGQVNSQDFFDFLGCFFAPPAGCP